MPFDSPSSARFLGTRLIVANQSALAGTTANQALLDVEAGETGLAELIPGRDATAPRLTKVSVSPKRFAAIRRGGKPRRARKRRPARGSKLRLTTSERVTLAVRVERRARGRWRRVQSFERTPGRRTARRPVRRAREGRQAHARPGRGPLPLLDAGRRRRRQPLAAPLPRVPPGGGQRPGGTQGRSPLGLGSPIPGRGQPLRRNSLPYARTIAAIACIAGLLAVPAAATAAKPKSANSHVIKTPKGNQLAVPITVRYKLDGKGKSLKRSTLKTRVTGAAKLADGRVLRATENRRSPGRPA